MKEIIFWVSIFFIIYILYEVFKVKKRIIRLTQENAIIWELLKEKEIK